MTGWRIGWLVGPSQIVAPALAVHQQLVTCAPRISQAAAREAFSAAGQAARLRSLERFRQRRALMAGELARFPRLRWALPDGAFYFFVDVSGQGDSLALSRRILERRNVITVPGVAFGPRGEGFLRLSFAASDGDIREGIERIGLELGYS
jgi:aspartate/methionine/tyrosine aminotransferase